MGFQWVDINFDPVHASNDINWTHVDEAVGATEQLRGRNMPREATAHVRNGVVTHTYGRNRKRKTRSDTPGDDSSGHEEEEDRAAPKQAQDASGAPGADEEMEDQGVEEDSSGPGTNDGNDEFHVDVDLLL